ncbi:MAG: hypothetical protein ABIH50_08415 [bacterium]
MFIFKQKNDFIAKIRQNMLLVSLAILSFIGTILVLICTARYGPGIDPDSISYMSTASSLLAGQGYLLWNGQPFTDWPPLFPTILAILSLTDLDFLNGAGFLNAIVFGLIIFTSGQLFCSVIRSRKLIILGTVSVLLSVPLLEVSVSVLSEPLFILLTILFIICLQKFILEKQWSYLFSLSLIAALACLQRYMGVTLIFTGLVIILFFMPGTSFLQKLKYAVVFCGLSLAPLLVWITRNHLLVHAFFGQRAPSSSNFSENIRFTILTLIPWFMPNAIFLLLKKWGGVS